MSGLATLRDDWRLGFASIAVGIILIAIPTEVFFLVFLSDQFQVRAKKRSQSKLIKALADNDENARRDAAKALGKIGDEQALEPLLAVLKDKDEGVRQNAAEALKKVNARIAVTNQNWEQAVSIGVPAIEPLIALMRFKNDTIEKAADDELARSIRLKLDNEHRNLTKEEANRLDVALSRAGKIGIPRSAAADALSKIGEPAIASLDAVLKDNKTTNAGVRGAAIDALIKIHSDGIVEQLVGALRDYDPDIRARAAKALGKVGDARAIQPLTIALKDNVDFVRSYVAEALEEINSKVLNT